MKKHLYGTLALAVASALLLGGCSANASSSSGGHAPIVVGSVNGLSGAATLPEASQAAQAVFNQVNAKGGINGHKIEYKITDDKGDPVTAASDAREVVSGDDAVALVGSASLIDCEINAKYYQQQNIMSIQGIGADPVCFNSPNISPANVGPFHDMTLGLLYGSEVLHLDRICALLEIAGNTLPEFHAAIAQWEEITGKKLFYEDDTVPYGAPDYTSYIVKAKQAGCQAVAGNPSEPDAIGWLKAAQAQGWNDVTWLLLTSDYSDQFAKAVTDAGKGVYLAAEFYPFTDAQSPQARAWRDLMTKNHIALTAFSQGGYLAAKYFVTAAESIKGPITRASVTKALHDLKPISDPMTGTPYTFGTGKTHNTNTAGWPIKLLSGTNQWQDASTTWLRIPKKP